MQDYSKVLKHEAENITLLCPTHHTEKTNKLMPLDRIYEANANPFNHRSGITTAHALSFGLQRPKIIVGSMMFTSDTTDFAAVVIDGNPLVGFSFREGHALLQIRLYDERNRLVLKVQDGELVHTTNVWDCSFVGSTLTVRRAARDIMLRMRLSPNANLVEIDRGSLQHNGIQVEIWPDLCAVLNTAFVLSDIAMVSPIGFLIGKNPRNYTGAFEFGDELPRQIDREAKLKSLAQYRKDELATQQGDSSP
ncbi:trigger factor [Mycolicibacterium sp. BK556]|nr:MULTISPECIES: hypothetical protein [unclassified Mycolicibacterium]MBB3602276.1 trigger factor [Mycolicibacterium sp. BK556]MBB3632028.1 trigger factor [Mycolicibacterium sp. BK607]